MVFAWEFNDGNFVDVVDPAASQSDLMRTFGLMIEHHLVKDPNGFATAHSHTVVPQLWIIVNDNFLHWETSGLWRVPSAADKMVALVVGLFGDDAWQLTELRFSSHTNCWCGLFNEA